LPHCVLGISVSVLTAITELLISGSQLTVGAVVVLAGWIPLAGLVLRPVLAGQPRPLTYEKSSLGP
jgi:hypothetical protein